MPLDTGALCRTINKCGHGLNSAVVYRGAKSPASHIENQVLPHYRKANQSEVTLAHFVT